MTLSALEGLDDRLVMDTSEKQPVYLLIGDNGAHLRISASTRELLLRVKQGMTFEQLAGSIRRGDGTALTAAEIETTYTSLTEKITRFQAQATQPRGLFWLRKKIIPASVVGRIARFGALAYHPAAVIACAVAVLVAAISSPQVLARASTDHFWAAYGIFVASILAHEFGHASACARFGAKPGEIGVVAFFIYPSFYSDVNAAWSLRRWQRVAVDLGGIYFQLLFGCGVFVAYHLSGWPPLRGTLFLIVASGLFSLNPVLKFDGYWVVADALGVTNLARQPARIIRHLAARARGQVVRPLPWPPAIGAALFAYSLVTFVFWGWLLWHLGPMIVDQAGRWGSLAVGLWGELLRGAPTWGTVRGLFTSTFMLLFVLLMLARLAGPLLGWLAGRARRTAHALAEEAR